MAKVTDEVMRAVFGSRGSVWVSRQGLGGVGELSDLAEMRAVGLCM